MRRGWVSDTFHFGLPVKAFFISGNLLALRAVRWKSDIEPEEIARELLKILCEFQAVPTQPEPKVIRIVLGYDQLGVMVWITHPTYPSVPEYESIPTVYVGNRAETS